LTMLNVEKLKHIQNIHKIVGMIKTICPDPGDSWSSYYY